GHPAACGEEGDEDAEGGEAGVGLVEERLDDVGDGARDGGGLEAWLLGLDVRRLGLRERFARGGGEGWLDVLLEVGAILRLRLLGGAAGAFTRDEGGIDELPDLCRRGLERDAGDFRRE